MTTCAETLNGGYTEICDKQEIFCGTADTPIAIFVEDTLDGLTAKNIGNSRRRVERGLSD